MALQLFADDLKDISFEPYNRLYDRPIEDNFFISNTWSTVSKALVIDLEKHPVPVNRPEFFRT